MNEQDFEILECSPEASAQEIEENYLRLKAMYEDASAWYSIMSEEERLAHLAKLQAAFHACSLSAQAQPYVSAMDSRPLHLSSEVSFQEPSLPEPLTEAIDPTLVPPMTLGKKAPLAPKTKAAPSWMEVQPQPKRQAFRQRMTSHQRSQPSKLTTELLDAIESEKNWEGSFLKQIREANQISIEEMSAITKVSKNYLIAIEDELMTKLPAPVYVRGFVIQIAKVLKLPAEKVASAYVERFRLLRAKE